tara:strand:- start:171 stop:536 length:366 start_codon:yes stop_codon:yes gene_type:complete
METVVKKRSRFLSTAAIGPAVHMNFSKLLDDGWSRRGAPTTYGLPSYVDRLSMEKIESPATASIIGWVFDPERSTTQGDAWLLRLCTPHPTPSVCTKQRVRQLLLSTKPLARHCVRQKRSY